MLASGVNHLVKFFYQTFVSGKLHFWNQHIKIIYKIEFIVFYPQMLTSIVTRIRSLQNWSLTEIALFG